MSTGDVSHDRPAPSDDERWSDTTLDLIVIDPETRKELGRLWMTVIKDDYSYAIHSYFIDFKPPDSSSIALALRHMKRRQHR